MLIFASELLGRVYRFYQKHRWVPGRFYTDEAIFLEWCADEYGAAQGLTYAQFYGYLDDAFRDLERAKRRRPPPKPVRPSRCFDV